MFKKLSQPMRKRCNSAAASDVIRPGLAAKCDGFLMKLGCVPRQNVSEFFDDLLSVDRTPFRPDR